MKTKLELKAENELEFEAENENEVATWTVPCAWIVTLKNWKWNPTKYSLVNSNRPPFKNLAVGLTKGH